MTQTERLKQLFDDHGGRLTLGDIMQTYLGASYRQRLTDLRRELAGEGKTITCYPCRVEGSKSLTYWKIEDLPKPLVYEEPSGQLAMVLK